MYMDKTFLYSVEKTSQVTNIKKIWCTLWAEFDVGRDFGEQIFSFKLRICAGAIVNFCLYVVISFEKHQLCSIFLEYFYCRDFEIDKRKWKVNHRLNMMLFHRILICWRLIIWNKRCGSPVIGHGPGGSTRHPLSCYVKIWITGVSILGFIQIFTISLFTHTVFTHTSLPDCAMT